MGNVDEMQRIMSNFIVTAAKEYVPTMCNLGELQMNLEELQRIIGNIPRGNLGELRRIMGIKVIVMAAKDYG